MTESNNDQAARDVSSYHEKMATKVSNFAGKTAVGQFDEFAHSRPS